MSKRFIIEGEWSGYTGRPQIVVHRTVHPASFKKLRAWVQKVRAINFTDGTVLFLKVRDCKPYEHVDQRQGYSSLISDCQFYDVSSVAELTQKRKEMRMG